MTTNGQDYWTLVEPYWEAVDIYGEPDEFLATFRPVPRPNALLLAAHWCQSEVRNGGFHQFFTNSTGVLAPEAVAGFEAIGRSDLAKLLRNAMLVFGSDYPRIRESRCIALNEDGEDQEDDGDTFVEMDDGFFEALEREAFEVSADRYARTIKSGDQ